MTQIDASQLLSEPQRRTQAKAKERLPVIAARQR
jgi:hypothetical protein